MAEAGLKARTRKGLAASVLAASLPDVDVFFGWVSWAPLAMHRGFTHGLVGGLVVLPPLLAMFLWMVDRWQVRRGTITHCATPMRFGWLLAICWLGALTHPLLDLQNIYAIQLLSPASERWFHTDGLFIISPWLLAFLGIGIWQARRTGRRRPAALALAGSALFIAANVAISTLAWAAPSRDRPYANPDRIFAGPEPLRFWRREVVWREAGMIGRGRYDPLRRIGGLIAIETAVPDRMNEPLVQRAAVATLEIRQFLDWSQMPISQIQRQGCTAVVTFGDARFAASPVAGSFTRQVVVDTCR